VIELDRQVIILSFIFLYMVLIIMVGLWAMRRTKSASDFFVAGHSLGPLVVGMAVFSSTMSGFGFVGGPGLVYSSGISSVWMAISNSFGFAVGFFLVAKRIRMIAEVRKTISLPDVVAVRYKSETVRFLTAITIVLGVMGYLATQILAMAIVLQTLLRATQAFAEIGLVTCVVISSAVLIFYCVTGGIIASVYTDLIQGCIMLVAGILVVVTAANVFDGGLAEASSIIMNNDPETIMPFGTIGIFGCFAWFFLFGLGLAGQPQVVTKMMMNRKISDNRYIFPLSVLGYAVSAMLWISVGVVMRALVVGNIHLPLSAADAATPSFLTAFTNPWLAGIVFASLFAAIMSTADAFLNIGAAAIIHDIPKAIKGRIVKKELLWARWATILLSVVAAVFAVYSYYMNDRLIALLGAFGWGTFAAALVPVVAIGLNWKRASRKGAIVAITVSLLINFVLELFEISIPYGISGGFVALLVSTILFITISLLNKPDHIPEDIRKVMDI
jgi:SSS family transporter